MSRETISAAHAAYREALEIFAAWDTGAVSRGLEGFACLALARGHAARALTWPPPRRICAN